MQPGVRKTGNRLILEEAMEKIRVNDQFRSTRSWTVMAITILVFHLAFLFTNQKAQAVPNGGYTHPELLIQPEELKALIDLKEPHLRIIDIREKMKYLTGHVPGAVHVWRPDIVDSNHRIPGMMPPKGQIEELMGRLGISDKNNLVIYSDGPDDTRLWWVLAYYGFPLGQVKLLDGGIEGWKSKNYPMEASTTNLERMSFKLQGKSKEREPLLCTLPQVKEALRDPKKVVLDVRSKEEYLGEKMMSGAVKAGRIPGVAFIEWKEALVKEGPYKGYWRSAEEIKKVFSDRGVTPDKEIYIY
jgi:thiosulfate/3-mercaptopyruvate sulfurtransferase